MEIEMKTQPFDLAFHPGADLVAAGLISGRISLYRYSDLTDTHRIWSYRAHRKDSVRALRFVNAGQTLLSVSPDRSIQATDVQTGQPIARLSDAHEAAINRIENLTESTVVTGDDEGTVKIWDTRQNSCLGSIQCHEDYVADFEFVPDTMQILSVGGDGTLCVSNMRRNRVDFKSEFSEEELLSVVRVKNGRKVVCGSQQGVLLLYTWAEFADCSDRFLGIPNSVDAMLKLDEDTVITGSADGVIRTVAILPSRITGVIGEHSDYPVERLGISHDGAVLGSISHDNMLKLWDLRSYLENSRGNTSVSTPVDMEFDEEEARGEEDKKLKGKGVAKDSSFFADL